MNILSVDILLKDGNTYQMSVKSIDEFSILKLDDMYKCLKHIINKKELTLLQRRIRDIEHALEVNDLGEGVYIELSEELIELLKEHNE